jgi:hypothetical protein
VSILSRSRLRHRYRGTAEVKTATVSFRQYADATTLIEIVSINLQDGADPVDVYLPSQGPYVIVSSSEGFTTREDVIELSNGDEYSVSFPEN